MVTRTTTTTRNSTWQHWTSSTTSDLHWSTCHVDMSNNAYTKDSASYFPDSSSDAFTTHQEYCSSRIIRMAWCTTSLLIIDCTVHLHENEQVRFVGNSEQQQTMYTYSQPNAHCTTVTVTWKTKEVFSYYRRCMKLFLISSITAL